MIDRPAEEGYSGPQGCCETEMCEFHRSLPQLPPERQPAPLKMFLVAVVGVSISTGFFYLLAEALS